ncbi:MAG TPA: hypothetical protein VF080_16565 [Solirubrobacteraceae bacterium]
MRRHVGERERQHGDRGEDGGAGEPPDRVGAAPAQAAARGGRRGAAVAAIPTATSSTPPTM